LRYLPEWGGQTVKDDPRIELIIGDAAYEYLLNSQAKYDVVVMDISDWIEAGPGIMLYIKELYEHVATKLTPNGVFVTQAGMADGVPPPHADAGEKDTVCFEPIRNTLHEVFQCVLPYTQGVPSFGADWGFVMGFNPNGSERDPNTLVKEWITLSPETIDELIEKNIKGGEASLKMYDGITHLRMNNLAKGKKWMKCRNL
jgi:spermidine synthase